MNPQSRTRASQDNRDDRQVYAQRTGEYLDEFTGGMPMTIINGRIVPRPGYLEAAKRRRRNIMNGRNEEDDGNTTDS